MSAPDPVLEGRPPAGLTNGVMGEVFFRSFFFQALWNFQRMQSLGWLFSYWPVLRRFYPDRARRTQAALEHLEYFNTYPTLVNLIIGVVAGLEEKRALGGPVGREQILSTRKLLSAPLAALGETLFAATARPLFAVASLSLGWAFVWESWWAVPMVYLLLNNAAHLLVRAAGMPAGYRHRGEVVGFLSRLNLQQIARGASLVGMGISLASLLSLWGAFGDGRWVAAGVAGGALAAFYFRVSAAKVFYLTMAACACLSWTDLL